MQPQFTPPQDDAEDNALAPPKPEPWHPIHDIPENSVVRAIAEYIYAQAPRQNRTLASVAAIALWAGLVGRNVNVSREGLNIYILAIAGTGRGKETMARAIERIIEAIATTVHGARDLRSGRFASSPAILQHLQTHRQTLSIQAEGEYLFKRLTSPKASQNDQDLLQTILDLYHKAGFGASLPGYRKADLAQSVAAIPSPCFSLLTESTIGAVNEIVGHDAIKRGVPQRFLIVMSKADRPYDNPTSKDAELDPRLVEYLSGVYAGVLSRSNPLQVTTVQFTPEATRLEKQFDRETTDLMNKGGSGVHAEIWNRSHLKALKLAALVATGVNHYCPQITAKEMQWAIDVERHNVMDLLAQLESGEVGEVTEDVRLSRVVKACAEYFQQREPWLFPKGYRVDPDLHDKGIITFTYLHNKLCKTAPFQKDGYKQPSSIIRDCLKVLVEKGDLAEINKAVMGKNYGRSIEGWQIANPRSFGM